METFKEHDILICMPGFKAKTDHGNSPTAGGVGYKLNKLLEVRRIVYNSGANDVIWPYNEPGKGVYRRALRLATSEEKTKFKKLY